MDIIANDLPRFDQDITDYSGHYQNLVNDYKTLIEQILSLINMWEGEAHDIFMQRCVADSKRVNELLDLMKEIQGELRFAHTEYSNCENAVRTIIENIAV